MARSHSSERDSKPRTRRQHISSHQASSRERAPDTEDANRAVQGSDFSQDTFERHASLLGDSRMSQPMYVGQRAEMMRQLQRDYGNSYVQRLVDHISRTRVAAIQTKLEVGPAGDKYEQEADRVAKEVVSSLPSASEAAAQREGAKEEELQAKALQRQEDEDLEDEGEIQTKPLGVQRQEEDELQTKPLQRVEDDKEMQMKALQRQEDEGLEKEGELQLKPLQRQVTAEGGEVGSDIEQTIKSARGGGQPLPDALRSPMESAFGSDFSGVRVHTGQQADALNQSVSARAFTTGQDIFVRNGDYNPGSSSGKELLAHELTHVVQQSGAKIRRVTAPANMKTAIKKAGKALTQHKKDRDKLKQYVQDGLKQKGDLRLVNSCDWVLSGKAKLYALTPTGDTSERVTAAGKDPGGEVAYFPVGLPRDPAGDIMSAHAVYNYSDLDDNTHVEIDDKGTVGWNLDHHVAVTDVPKRSKKYVWETLKHEVQHDSDKSSDKKAAALATGNNDAFKLERYKTEYRAYNYEGGKLDKYSHAKTVQKEGYTWTEKQYEVFKQIRSEYEHTETGWQDNNDVGGGVTFQEAVVAYSNPDTEGFNKYNSARVDDFYNALKQVDNTMLLMDDKVQDLVQATTNLNPDDANYLNTEAADMQKLMASNLSDVVKMTIKNYIRQKTG